MDTKRKLKARRAREEGTEGRRCPPNAQHNQKSKKAKRRQKKASGVGVFFRVRLGACFVVGSRSLGRSFLGPDSCVRLLA